MHSKMALRVVGLFTVGIISTAAANRAVADTSPAPQTTLSNGVAVSGTRASTPSQGLLTDRVVASLGTFVVNTNITATLNGESAKNPAVDFNERLGIGGDFNRGRLDVIWRINPKHHVRFLVFANDVTRNTTIDAPLDWGDYTFQAGATVKTESSFNVYELGYEYAFLIRPTYEIAGTAGIHLMDMSLKLSGTATVTDASGNTSSASFQTSQSDLPAPLPVVGLRAGWSVAPHWYLDAQAQVFKFDYQGFNGTWSDLRAGVTWMFSRHFGIGAAYNRFNVNVDVNRATYNGNVTLGYSGTQVFITGSY